MAWTELWPYEPGCEGWSPLKPGYQERIHFSVRKDKRVLRKINRNRVPGDGRIYGYSRGTQSRRRDIGPIPAVTWIRAPRRRRRCR